MSGLYNDDPAFGAHLRADREFVRLDSKAARATAARAALEPGCSRKRLATATARWKIACEARDRRLFALLETFAIEQAKATP